MYMKKLFGNLLLLVLMIGIIMNNTNYAFAAGMISVEPPVTKDVESIPKLFNWIEKSRDYSFANFLESARNQDELLVVIHNGVFPLTRLYVDGENAMNYVFERNQLRFTVRVFLPDNTLYANMDEFIVQKNEQLSKGYEEAQFTLESVTINDQDVDLYYIDGGTYTSKENGTVTKYWVNAYFVLDGYPIQIVMSTTGSYNYPLKWSSSDLEKFDFIFINKFVSGDVNENGQIEAADALDVLKDCVKQDPLTIEKSFCADVNGDSNTDADDALLILKRTVKLIKKFPVEEL